MDRKQLNFFDFARVADTPLDDFESKWNTCSKSILNYIYTVKDLYKVDSPDDILHDVAIILLEKDSNLIKNYRTYGCGVARRIMALGVMRDTRVRHAVNEIDDYVSDSSSESESDTNANVIKSSLMDAVRDKLYKSLNEKERIAYDCLFRKTLSREDAAKRIGVRPITLLSVYAWKILPSRISEILGVSAEKIRRILVKQRETFRNSESAEHGEVTIRDANGNVKCVVKQGEVIPASARTSSVSMNLFSAAA